VHGGVTPAISPMSFCWEGSVIPNKALSSGFVFRHETLRSAFEAIL
jgi:NAD dependent epimerase/dehydratase family enzyme